MTAHARPIVFLGPTLAVARAQAILDATYRPPAAQGDVLHAAQRRPPAIALIDGHFERVPSVWHKELLYALSEGIPVYGAASLGALRAVECAPFGMLGVGRIFEAYRDGKLEEDDAVAVAHATGAEDYRPLSDALVNLRATLARAVEAKVIPRRVGRELEALAAKRFYPDRTWRGLLADARTAGVDAETCDALAQWWPAHAVDLKAEDAMALLALMRGHMETGTWPVPSPFTFEATTQWEAALARHEEPRDGEAEAETQTEPAPVQVIVTP